MLHPRNLPPQPIPRLPTTEIRPLPQPRRRPRRRRNRIRPTHETRRGVPALHPAPAGVQVLAFEHTGDRVGVRGDVPVFWPVLVVYFVILFGLTSMSPLNSPFFFPAPPFFDLIFLDKWDGDPKGNKNSRKDGKLTAWFTIVRRQIQHMIKYRYVPFTFGKARYNQRSGH